MRSWPSLFPAVVAAVALPSLLACGGPPLATKDEAATALAHGATPAKAAKGALLQLYGSGISTPSIDVPGPKGGKATLNINPLGAAVGATAGGVLFDIQYDGFTADGEHVFDGLLSATADFGYVEKLGEDPSVDFSLKLIGKVELSGIRSDELDTNVTLALELEDLSLRDESVRLFLDGKLDTPGNSFVFAHEDLEARWER